MIYLQIYIYLINISNLFPKYFLKIFYIFSTYFLNHFEIIVINIFQIIL